MAQENYFSWNRSVANALFPYLEQPELVFLDIEGDSLEIIAADQSVEPSEVIPGLTAAVSDLLRAGSLQGTFSWFEHQTRLWQVTETDDEPPALGLLALFALAAKRMERDEKVAAHNYYDQLARVLSLEKDEVSTAYRRNADKFWDSLAIWLENHDGLRGLPVKFIVGKHKYIGRARAQALVRDVDRRRLQHFFQQYDLTPHLMLDEEQIRPLFEQWIASHAAAGQFKEIWAKSEVKDHLLTAVVGVLAAWDGHLSADDAAEVGSSRIRFALDRIRLRPGVRLGFVLQVPNSQEHRTAKLHTGGGETDVELAAGRPGLMFISRLNELLPPRAVLEGKITLTDKYAGQLVREPRRLVVLREDPAVGSWIETSQVRLGEEVKILVRNDVEIDALLEQVSGTVWTVKTNEELSGLHEGWNLIENVVIAGFPETVFSDFDDRNALVPITDAAFDFSAGLRIPMPVGSELHYHHAAPPRLSVNAGGAPFSLSLYDMQTDDRVLLEEPWESKEGLTVLLDLGRLDLAPGKYQLELSAQGKVRERTFWLARSGTELGDYWHHETVAHDVDDVLSAVQRTETNVDESEYLIHGTPQYELVDETTVDQATLNGIAKVPWWRRERETRAAYVTVEYEDAESCVWTGRHHEQLPTVLPDEKGYYSGVSIGTCKGCGRQKKYNNSYWTNHRRWERKQASLEASGEKLPVGQQRELVSYEIDWDTAWDLVLLAGGGDEKLMRKITMQFDPSARFYHDFVNTLESLGHIEVRRSLETGEVTHWETAPTTLVDQGDKCRLVGHWTAEAIADLEINGVELQRESSNEAPTLITALMDPQELEEVSPGNFISVEPSMSLVNSLLSLREVIKALPAQATPTVNNWERYSPVTDNWELVRGMYEPGAYRTGEYSRRYYLVSEEDLQEGYCMRVNVALAKHAAHLVSKEHEPLVAYSARDRQLVTPLGAPLPGMYGRALTLASGRPPKRRDVAGHGSYVVYSDISPTLASNIYSLIR